MFKRALISVSDKRGLSAFLQALLDQNPKIQLFSTTGTGHFLQSKGFQTRDIEELTSFPSLFSGRVKSLHPHIYAPLLSRSWIEEDRKSLKSLQLEPFDLLVVNLYPFEEKSTHLNGKELAEWIDVGGPGMLRAGAKNYFDVTVACEPKDYQIVLKASSSIEIRKQLAAKVFEKLAFYDSLIAKTLKEESSKEGELAWPSPKSPDFLVQASFFKELSYGENPHQKAIWLKKKGEAAGLHSAIQLSGKALSYNNVLDFSEAAHILRDFKAPFAVALKHNNPCGAGEDSSSISKALEKALKTDPLSLFGGILALNRAVDEAMAQQLKPLFLEGILALDFSSEALTILKKKKNLRLLKWPGLMSEKAQSSLSLRELEGGFLLQTRDHSAEDELKAWSFFGQQPSDALKEELLFAWKLSAHLKSNAISLVKQKQALGLGMGQVSRVDAVHLALNRAKKFHPAKNKDLILAGDGFFPFPDFIEPVKKAGVSWIVQPGGSIRDKEVLEKVLSNGLNMAITGKRHFKH